MLVHGLLFELLHVTRMNLTHKEECKLRFNKASGLGFIVNLGRVEKRLTFLVNTMALELSYHSDPSSRNQFTRITFDLSKKKSNQCLEEPLNT